MGKATFWQRLETAKKPREGRDPGSGGSPKPASRGSTPRRPAVIDWSNDPVPELPPLKRTRVIRLDGKPMGQGADEALRHAMRLADDVKNRR